MSTVKASALHIGTVTFYSLLGVSSNQRCISGFATISLTSFYSLLGVS